MDDLRPLVAVADASDLKEGEIAYDAFQNFEHEERVWSNWKAHLPVGLATLWPVLDYETRLALFIALKAVSRMADQKLPENGVQPSGTAEIGLTPDERMVAVQFFNPDWWVHFTPAEARQFAATMCKKADEAKT